MDVIAATCAQDSKAICVITRINVMKKKVFIVIFNSMMVLEEYAGVRNLFPDRYYQFNIIQIIEESIPRKFPFKYFTSVFIYFLYST